MTKIPSKKRFQKWEEEVLLPVLSQHPERRANFQDTLGDAIKRLYTGEDLQKPPEPFKKRKGAWMPFHAIPISALDQKKIVSLLAAHQISNFSFHHSSSWNWLSNPISESPQDEVDLKSVFQKLFQSKSQIILPGGSLGLLLAIAACSYQKESITAFSLRGGMDFLLEDLFLQRLSDARWLELQPSLRATALDLCDDSKNWKGAVLQGSLFRAQGSNYLTETYATLLLTKWMMQELPKPLCTSLLFRCSTTPRIFEEIIKWNRIMKVLSSELPLKRDEIFYVSEAGVNVFSLPEKETSEIRQTLALIAGGIAGVDAQCVIPSDDSMDSFSTEPLAGVRKQEVLIYEGSLGQYENTLGGSYFFESEQDKFASKLEQEISSARDFQFHPTRILQNVREKIVRDRKAFLKALADDRVGFVGVHRDLKGPSPVSNEAETRFSKPSELTHLLYSGKKRPRSYDWRNAIEREIAKGNSFVEPVLNAFALGASIDAIQKVIWGIPQSGS